MPSLLLLFSLHFAKTNQQALQQCYEGKTYQQMAIKGQITRT